MFLSTVTTGQLQDFVCTSVSFVVQTTVPGIRNNVILQPLQSDTPYKITVVAVYEDGDGGQLTGNGRTGNYSFHIVNSFFKFKTYSLSTSALLWFH